jgi:hypothetical protein
MVYIERTSQIYGENKQEKVKKRKEDSKGACSTFFYHKIPKIIYSFIITSLIDTFYDINYDVKYQI